MKPGNSVEEKTLTIRKGAIRRGVRVPRARINPRPGWLEGVIKRGEVVDERWQ